MGTVFSPDKLPCGGVLLLLLKCCFTSTETVGLLGTGACVCMYARARGWVRVCVYVCVYVICSIFMVAVYTRGDNSDRYSMQTQRGGLQGSGSKSRDWHQHTIHKLSHTTTTTTTTTSTTTAHAAFNVTLSLIRCPPSLCLGGTRSLSEDRTGRDRTFDYVPLLTDRNYGLLTDYRAF